MNKTDTQKKTDAQPPKALPARRIPSWTPWALAVMFLTVWCVTSGTAWKESATVYAGVFAILIGMTLRPWTSLCLTQILLLDLALANHIKLIFLSTPLVVHDIIYLAKDLTANIAFVSAYPMIIATAVATFVTHVALVFILIRKERPRKPAFGFKPAWLSRIAIAVFSVVAAVAFWALMLNQREYRPGRITEYNAEESARNHRRLFEVTNHDNNYFLNAFEDHAENPTAASAAFLSSFRKLGIYNAKAPRGAKAVAELIKTALPAKLSGKRPDIFAVLQESHADLSPLGITPANVPGLDRGVTPVWDGQVRVHTFGGGTPLSEFAFLSGYAWGDFGLAGLYAHDVLSPKMKLALPHRLKAIGYRTIALYPVTGSFYNAKNAYKGYGFDEFYSIEELGIKAGWTDNKISDAALYDAAAKLIRPKPADTRPVFLFVLTIANHGPHSRTKAGTPQAYIPASIPRETVTGLSNYLAGYEKTELALSHFARTWFNSPRPRLMVMFGDHWPSLEGGTKTIAQYCHLSNEDIYTTQSRILANYDTQISLPKKMDLAFLGTAVMEAAGLPLDAFDEANRAVRIKTDGKYANYQDQELIEGYLDYTRDTAHAWSPE